MQVIWDACCKGYRLTCPSGDHEYRALIVGDEFGERGISVSYLVKPGENLANKYIIWSPESTLPPRMVFDTEAEAVAVASDMARKNIGSRFAVASINGVAETVAVEYKSFNSKTKATKR